jgi:hypothetical protein
LLILLFNLRSGLRVDVGLAMVVLLPLMIHFGPATAAAVLTIVLAAAWFASCGLAVSERQLLLEMWSSAVNRLALRRPPASLS